MKGEMDYSRESAGNDITFLRDGFHFFLYPMALSHLRVCFDKLETPIRLLLELNFIGVLSPQVSPASRRVTHGGFVARGLRLAWHSAERSPQKSPSVVALFLKEGIIYGVKLVASHGTSPRYGYGGRERATLEAAPIFLPILLTPFSSEC